MIIVKGEKRRGAVKRRRKIEKNKRRWTMNCPVVTGPRQVTHLNDVGSFPGPFGLYRKVLVIISPCGAFPSADIKQVSAL